MVRWPVWSWGPPLPIRELAGLYTRLLASPPLSSAIAATLIPTPISVSALPVVYFLMWTTDDFDPTSAWGGGDEVTATMPVFGW